jgi:HEAT repeat protein
MVNIMNLMNKFISIIFLTLFVLVGSNLAQDDLLSRVPQLQETARAANSGRLGCGKSDFVTVFRGKVTVSDLLVLLEARAEANRTGEPNPMSGEVKDLVYVILSGLPSFKDATVIPVVRELLEDKNEVIRGWSAIALFRLAEQSEDLRKEIEKITFPKAAVQSAAGRGVKLPTWAKMEGDS